MTDPDQPEVIIDPPVLWQVRELSRLAGRRETGGCLLGRYTPDGRGLRVTRHVPRPPDSVGGLWNFTRGTAGLDDAVAAASRASGGHDGYVGEWHSHPRGHPSPSACDDATMEELVLDPAVTEVPVLLILSRSGPPLRRRWSAGIYVYSAAGRSVLPTVDVPSEPPSAT